MSARFALVGILLVLSVAALASPLSPLMVYQGQLKQDGVPVNGLADLEFTLWDSAVAGAQVGPTQTRLNLEIVDGLFTAMMDFTPPSFSTSEARWMQIRVRYPAGIDPYVLLADRQLITATPYAQAVRLPLSQSFAGSTNLFSITNTGSAGAAGVFAATNVGHLGPVLSATASGVGTAFLASTPAAGTAISASSGLGRAGSFTGGGSSPALIATNSSSGPAVSAVNSGSGPALFSDGDLTFNDDNDGIIFNLTVAPSVPMISMFALGSANDPRMVIAHSRSFSNYGLQYEDATEEFHFLGNGNRAVSINLDRPDASPGSGGFLVVGSPTSLNLALDNNEIMARSNGAAGTLALNADGGDVTVSQSGSGSLGIGTSNPQGTLHVAGGADAEPSGGGLLVLGFTNGGNLAMDGNEIMARNNGAASTLSLNADGGNVAICQGGGSVGIGTANPQGKLHIAGSDDAEPSGGGLLVLGFTNAGNIAIDGNEIMARNNGATSDLYLNNDGGNIHMAVAGGGVSIGTTNVPPGVRLAVDGKIMCEEMEVQLSGDWPDFVFDDEYSLMPLPELEKSIAANKHLPGMPSASNIAETGINIGQIQTKTLQKVEELTLYMIELNKQVEAMRAENAQLRERIAELEGGR